jgi:Helicase HerA, central domain/TraM recognition site of TraD and TraG
MKPLLLGYDARGKPVRLNADDRKIHMHVIGSSGSGKSRFLEWLIRGDLKNHQGFCLIDPHGELYDAVVSYCARKVITRPEIVLLNLSEPRDVIGFNPFRKFTEGDVSVQVDRRITATMHAWGVPNTDETPTLARTLRLIYTVMIEQGLGLPQVEHLLNFSAKDVRSFLVERLQTPLIRREWLELQELKPRDWRDEILSAKNRLFKLLTSAALKRFMGLADVSINLREVMDQGKVLLVNLKQSAHLSYEAARTFGALLVNEFFEAALERRRAPGGRDPRPYYLYLDEFQNFVSLDISRMLAEVRKFGLFLILSHQYFEQLDEDITAAAMNNCQIKSVFGGLSVPNARRMAEELFIGKLDPEKVKVAIYQTKFWPEYRRDKVYAQTTTTGTAHGVAHSSAAASFSGLAGGQTFYTPDNWFASSSPTGMSSEVVSSGSTSSSSNSYSDMDSESHSESEIDIPIFFPVPFQELSAVQFHSIEEQLVQLTAALKLQFQRHCFIQIRQQETQPMLVPFVEPIKTFAYDGKNLDWYIHQQQRKQGALPTAEIDRLLEKQETALLQAAGPSTQNNSVEEPQEVDATLSPPTVGTSIWNRSHIQSNVEPSSASSVRAVQRKPGPKPDKENHAKVVKVISAYGETWVLDENLMDICDELDRQLIPVPKTWATRKDGSARSWSRARQYYPQLVIKAIKDRCKAALQPEV